MKALLLLLLAVPVLAQDAPEQAFPLPLFSEGLYTRYSANAIPDGALSQALNVLVDEDVNGVVVARRGYSKYNASALTNTKSVRGLWAFDANDGTHYMVAFTSAAFYKTSGDGIWTLITGMEGYSSSKDFDCVQTLGKLYCANGDTVASWDGTSTATVTNAPLGNLVGRFRNRLLIAGIAGSRSRLRGSGELDTSDWTVQVPGVSTTPFSIAFGGVDDGDNITCLMGAFQDVFLIGKRTSVWGLYGFGRNDFEVRELSREVGCTEQHSVQEKNNCLYWMSARGIEKFCGTQIERVGDPIRDSIDNIVAAAGTPRSAVDTTQSDFEAGNLAVSGAGAKVSATIPVNSVSASTWGLNDQTFTGTFSSAAVVNGVLQISTGAPFRNAGFEDQTFLNWTAPNMRISAGGGSTGGPWGLAVAQNATAATDCTNFPVDGCKWTMEVYSYATGAILFSSTTYGAASAVPVTVYPSSLTVPSTDLIYVKAYNANYSSYSLTSAAFPNWRDGFTYLFSESCQVGGKHLCTQNFDMYENAAGVGFSSMTFLSQAYDTAFSTPTWGVFSSTYTQFLTGGTSVYFQTQVSRDGVTWDTLKGDSDTVRIPDAQKEFIRYKVTIQQSSSTLVGSVNTVNLTAATTGYFISRCRNATNASTWGTLSCNMSQPGSALISLSISTGNSCNQVTRTTATWTAMNNNAVISVATGPYVAYRALFDFSAATDAVAGLSIRDCTISWNEGSSRPPVWAQVYRDRYYLSYTSSTDSGATNDNVLVLDKNDKWTLFDNHHCYSMTYYNRKLYCGSSTSLGQVWQLDSGSDDDGTAIDSKIRTKAFNLGLPDSRKEFDRLYLDLEPSPDISQTITLTGRYTLERSTPTYSLGTVDLNEDPGSIMRSKFPFPLTNPTTGRYIQVEIESNGRNNPWRLFGGRLYYSPLVPD